MSFNQSGAWSCNVQAGMKMCGRCKVIKFDIPSLLAVYSRFTTMPLSTTATSSPSVQLAMFFQVHHFDLAHQ